MSTPAGDGAKSGQSTGTEVQGKRGVDGETSAADRETRKKAKVDYNEEKSGIKKKGDKRTVGGIRKEDCGQWQNAER